jgi:hypothetical protein
MMIYARKQLPLEVKHVHGQSIAILNGDLIVEKADIPLASLLVSLREELLQLISAESLQRFVSALIGILTGWNRNLLTKEKIFPTVEECIAIRENSLCLFLFWNLWTWKQNCRFLQIFIIILLYKGSRL